LHTICCTSAILMRASVHFIFKVFCSCES